MARLVFISEAFRGQTHELAVEETTVGRGEHNTLVIRDPSVSADHCIILTFGDEIIVRERGSRNGTFLDDRRVQGQAPMKAGQTLRLGAVEARLELDPEDLYRERDDHITAIGMLKQLRREAREQPATVAVPRPVAAQTTAPPMKAGSTLALARPHVSTLMPSRTQSLPPPRPPASDARWRFWFFVVLAIALALAVGMFLLLRRGY